MGIGWLWHEKTKAPVTGLMMVGFERAGQANKAFVTL